MLPVANRALVTLSLLLPGTSQDGTRPRRNNAQVGAGTLQFTTLALADGTLNMSTKAGEPRQDFPQAAVREVRVVTSSAPAEFGGRAGGVVSVVTRGGTNAFSGEAYEYFRNKAMDRLDPLTAADLEARGPGAAGLLTSSVRRCARRTDHPRSAALLRRGGADERGGTLPHPDGPARVLREVRRASSRTSRRDRLFFVRGDMQLNPSQNAFARWAYQGNWNPCEGCGGSAHGGSDTYIPRAALVAGHTWVIGTRFLNEFRFQWGGQSQYQGPHGAPALDGLQTRSAPSGSSTCSRTSRSRASATRPTRLLRAPRAGEARVPQRLLHLDVEPQHQARRRVPEPHAEGGRAGQSGRHAGSSRPISSSITRTRRSCANLRGPSIQFTASFPPLIRHQPHDYYQVYVQDDWRILSNVTLNLGLRYEVETKIWGEDRDNNTFYPAAAAVRGLRLARRHEQLVAAPRTGVGRARRRADRRARWRRAGSTT